jgi:hypothetical protein
MPTDSDRFTALETRVTSVEARTDTLEKGAVKTDTALMNLTKKVDDLTASQKLQLEILQRLDAVAANPNVKIILAIVATVLASWAASKGLK